MLLSNLPVELLHHVCLKVPKGMDLVHLSSVNSVLRNVLSVSQTWFWDRWIARHVAADRVQDIHDNVHRFGFLRALVLYNERGCELCGKARIRKVYPFGVRCCKECLYARTVCTFYLPVTLQNIPLPYNTRVFPKRGYGRSAYEARFFWKSQVERYVLNHHGMSLSDYRDWLQGQATQARAQVLIQKKTKVSLTGKLQRRFMARIKASPHVTTYMQQNGKAPVAFFKQHARLPEADMLNQEADRLFAAFEQLRVE